MFLVDVKHQSNHFELLIRGRHTGRMNPAVEIVRLEMPAEQAERFVLLRAQADAALARFDGFVGTELLRLGDQDWLLLVRWTSLAAASAAQQITLAAPGLPEINAWVALARQVRSFETGEQRHFHLRTSP
jgi:hypothetical protein